MIKFLCVSITPFGSPVVPEVKMIQARSSSVPFSSSCSTRPGFSSRYFSPLLTMSVKRQISTFFSEAILSASSSGSSKVIKVPTSGKSSFRLRIFFIWDLFSTITVLHSATERIKRRSCSVASQPRGTSKAPIESKPKSACSHSFLLSEIKPMCSPRTIPRCNNPAPKLKAILRHSLYVIGWNFPSLSFEYWKGISGYLFAIDLNNFGIVFSIGSST